MTSSAVPPPLPLELCRFAVVDLETTGSAPPGGRVLEVAVAMLEGGTVHLAYHTLLDPGVSVPAAVVRLTGITDQLVAGRPRFADVAAGLARLLEDAILDAHTSNPQSAIHNPQFPPDAHDLPGGPVPVSRIGGRFAAARRRRDVRRGAQAAVATAYPGGRPQPDPLGAALPPDRA